jgi:hypothetical protein
MFPGSDDMPMFSFHLVEISPLTTVFALLRPPSGNRIKGLRHAECLSVMTLGASILSLERLQLHHFAMFAAWENESALESFLTSTQLGHDLSQGWHVRLKFLRQ